MMRCMLCAFETELDDAVVVGHHGRCICLRCYLRETDTAKPMEKGLRQQVIETLNLIERAEA